MIVAGGFKNPNFSVEEMTIEEMMDKIKTIFIKSLELGGHPQDALEIAQAVIGLTLDDHQAAVSEIRNGRIQSIQEKGKMNQSIPIMMMIDIRIM